MDPMKIQLFRSKPGTAPGHVALDERSDRPVRSRVVDFSPDAIREESFTGDPPPADASETRWIDVVGRNPRTVVDLGHHLGLHQLVVEDIAHGSQRSKVEDYEDSLFVVADVLHWDPDGRRVSTEQVSLVLQESRLVSVVDEYEAVFEGVRGRLRAGRGRIRGSGPGYLAYALLDAVVDHTFPVLEALGEEIEAAEDSIADGVHREDSARLHRIRQNLVLLRRAIWPLRDTVARLGRSESPLITEETRLFLRDVADHLALAADMVEAYREMTAGLMDLYQSALANRMNEVMKVLTIIATLFIPLSFIAGVYGMNFDPSAGPLAMPELRWAWGYPAALGLMAAIAGGLLVFFRRKGWI
jgi:magnesium transporter